MAKILIIDDDQDVLISTSNLLKSYSYSVITATNGKDGMDMALAERPDLILLDWMMPNYSGLDFLKDFELRDEYNTPVILLTAIGSGGATDNYEVDALNTGAVKFISKPYDAGVLLTNIKAVLRIPRNQNISSGDNDVQVHVYNEGELIIDHNQRQAYRYGEDLMLTNREFEVLAFLEKNAGIVVSREELTLNVWKFDFYGDVRTVDVTIRRTREKIEPDQDQNKYKYIKTRRGSGYYFPKQMNVPVNQ